MEIRDILIALIYAGVIVATLATLYGINFMMIMWNKVPFQKSGNSSSSNNDLFNSSSSNNDLFNSSSSNNDLFNSSSSNSDFFNDLNVQARGDGSIGFGSTIGFDTIHDPYD